MNRLAVLLIGINVSALCFAIGFAPRFPTCMWTTDNILEKYRNCHQTDHVLPTLIGVSVLTASYYFYRRPEPSPIPPVPYAPRPAAPDEPPAAAS